MDALTTTGVIANRLIRARFVATVFAGSFLLFLVQPMIARMALPRLGGAPSVWNSAMLVYQALLLAGYAYAHWLGRLAPRRQAMVHLILFGLAALTLPIALIAGAPEAEANIFLWVPWLLLVSVGPLFLVISAQAPLMQRWFALAGGGDPYPLYAASNFGSFLGLLAYPLVLEPLMSVESQSMAWSMGYGALALFVIACALQLPRSGVAAVISSSSVRPSHGEMIRWIALAAIPSGLMLSTTLHLTTDIVAMPLLWVLPLGLYLLSYSVAFSSNRRLANLFNRIAPFALLGAGCAVFANATPLALVIGLATLLFFFIIAVAIHAMLFDRRPDPAHLTIFYLCTSIGGVIGGLFCALIAPLTFDWTYEYPILLAAAALAICQPNPFDRWRKLWLERSEPHLLLCRLGLAAVFLSLMGNGIFGLPGNQVLVFAGALAIIGIAIVAIGNRLLFGIAVTSLMLCLGGWDKLTMSNAGLVTRSFFGIDTILPNANVSRSLIHGTTVHGVQLLGSPERERVTTMYYAPRSGVGLAMKSLPAIFPNARVGIVGLGAGTLSCASSPGQAFKFYEIDPKVVEIARKEFSFLSNCQPKAPIVIGDARLTLEQQSDGGADMLVIDAFSSDSVPMHLLTLEAFDVYRKHLSAEGLLMVHISNRYLDLRPVVAAAAARGWTARVRTYWPTAEEMKVRAGPSMWVAMSPSPKTIAMLEKSSGKDGWRNLPPAISTPWTDDYASILPLIKWRG